MLFLQHTRHRIFYNKLLNNNSGDLTCCQQIGFVKGIVIKITFKSVQFNVEKWMLFLQHDQLWNLDNNLLINNSGVALVVNKLVLLRKFVIKITFTLVQFDVVQWMLFLQRAQHRNLHAFLADNTVVLLKKLISKWISYSCNIT